MAQSNYHEKNQWQRRWAVVQEFFKRGCDIRWILYRMQFRAAPKMDKVTKFPTHLDIELSDACNLRCIMCTQGIEDGVKGAGNMDTTFAKQIPVGVPS